MNDGNLVSIPIPDGGSDTTKTWEEIGAILQEHFHLEPTEQNVEHFLVLLECMGLYQERDKSYGPVWKRYGALSNLLRGAAKIDRLLESWWRRNKDEERPVLHKDNLDDAFDLINYMAFFIRSARYGNIAGDSGLVRGTVSEAGGGVINIYIDRDAESYPKADSHVVIIND